jgi:hypothetical protein
MLYARARLIRALGGYCFSNVDNWRKTNMESTESNKVSSEVVLEQARSWKDKGATLLLSISSEPDKRFICDKLAGRLSYVADDRASLAFDWQRVESDPKVSAKPLVDGKGRFVVWLADASFSMLDTPQKSMTIVRGSYQCILTEVHASAFG